MILIDSHVIIWLGIDPRRLSAAAKKAVRQAVSDGQAGISTASVYEIVNAVRRGRVLPAVPLQALLARIRGRFRVFPVSEEIAITAAQLADPFPGDPMDRLIAATAIVENCTLLTADRRLRAARVCKTLW